jgi:signal transduction histidine kinase
VKPPRPVLLAVEDEEPIIELLATLVGPLDVELVAAVDGREALTLLEKTRPSLITLDLVLPDVDGYMVLEQIRRRGSLDEVPVVVLTALSDSTAMKRAYALGASDFITKPFNVAIVEAKLRMFLRMVRLAEEVRERERFLEDVMEHISSGLLVCDADGRVRRLNPAGAAALGLDDAQGALGRLLGEVAPGAEEMLTAKPGASQRQATLQNAPDGGEAANTAGAGDSAQPRTLGFNTARLTDGGAVAVFREISAVERARREAEERARHEALSRAARSFAHEVRNPLAAIAAAAQVVGRDDAPLPLRKRLSRAIETESLRVACMVREYVERQTPVVVAAEMPLGALLEEVVEVNLLDGRERERVRLDVPPSLPPVLGDPARLKQVVLNLLSNAIAATEGGGEVTLAARAEDRGVKLTVRDTGTGIAPTVLPRIFEENFTTRPDGKGLGLPIARKIVEEHGGSLRVESALGHGTTFTVWLRAAAGAG